MTLMLVQLAAGMLNPCEASKLSQVPPPSLQSQGSFTQYVTRRLNANAQGCHTITKSASFALSKHVQEHAYLIGPALPAAVPEEVRQLLSQHVYSF